MRLALMLGQCDAYKTLSLGDPMQTSEARGEARGPRLGPLVSQVQRERVRSYIRKGVEEGARLVTGGAEAPEDLPRGYFDDWVKVADEEALHFTLLCERLADFGTALAKLCLLGKSVRPDIKTATLTKSGLEPLELRDSVG